MHPIERAALADICANPSDDAPRLRFADWLCDETNAVQTPRAEFIRLQCKLGSVHEPHACGKNRGYGCWVCRLHEREQSLLGGSPPGWLEFAGAAAWIVPDGASYTHRLRFSRGFVSGIVVEADVWLEHADVLASQVPLESVELTTAPQIEFNVVMESTAIPHREGRRKVVWSWDARQIGKPWEKCAYAVEISEEAASRYGGTTHFLQEHRERARNAATPMGYLKAKWPRVKFTLPQCCAASESSAAHGIN